VQGQVVGYRYSANTLLDPVVGASVPPIVWASSDPKVASVTPDGVATGTGKGTADIIANGKGKSGKAIFNGTDAGLLRFRFAQLLVGVDGSAAGRPGPTTGLWLGVGAWPAPAKGNRVTAALLSPAGASSSTMARRFAQRDKDSMIRAPGSSLRPRSRTSAAAGEPLGGGVESYHLAPSSGSLAVDQPFDRTRPRRTSRGMGPSASAWKARGNLIFSESIFYL
jgi:hypothetical protein